MVDLREQLLNAHRRSHTVIGMELQVAIAPVQRPQPRGFRVTQPGDREPCPLRPDLRLPRRAAFHDRHMALGDFSINTNLFANMLGNPSAAPPLHPSNVRLRQTQHAR